MIENIDNLLDYFAALNILKSLYEDGIMSFELFDKMNRNIAGRLKVEPITNFSHIRQNEKNTVR